MPQQTSHNRTLYVLVAAIYLMAFPYHPKLRSPNELSRLWQSRALIDHGTIELNQTLREFGYVGDLSKKDGRYFPSKAPLLSFAAAPIYWALKNAGTETPRQVPEIPQVFWSRLLLTVLPTLLLLFYLRKFLSHFVSAFISDVVVVTYALGSLAFSYSLAFIGHQTTAVLVFGAFYNLWKHQQGAHSAARLTLAGVFAGAAIANEYTAALPILALVIYELHFLLRSQKTLGARVKALVAPALLTTMGAAPFLLCLMWYHQLAFGHPLESGYKYLNDLGYQGWHVGGFLGIRFPDPNAFRASFFSPLRGLFTTSPFLLLAVPGIWKMRHARFAPELLSFTIALVLGYTYFTSSFAYESWGWTTGPRHLTPLIPFLLLPIALSLEGATQRFGLRHAVSMGAVGGLCVISILSFGTVVMVNYIPDSLSTALFGGALPLLKDGYLSPTVLLFLGIPNPASGGMLWAIVGLVGLFLGMEWARHARMFRWATVLTGLAVGALCLLPIWKATRHDEQDLGAVQHLKNSWLAPPKVPVSFW